MRGFKSFADKTTLELEPGVTTIVGPNGSGKSNVVDAVAWVLGAQGARALRGSKMDDVIFAGTASRPALGRAEVQLLIDNSDGRIPIDFSEVTISRTLFRSGESEYALNGTPCRLLDIQELLSDSGIGRQQHVIVGQGQLDAVLNSQPVDRRMIIEEAAGILKYRRRKEKAERRLETTEGNVIRLGDMVREVRRSLTPLGRQAEAARRSGDLASELRAIKVFLLGQELNGLKEKLGRVADQRREFAQSDLELRSTLGRLDAEVILAENELGGTDVEEVNELRRHVEALRERRRGLTAVLAERQRSLERELEAIADEDVYESLVADAVSVRAGLAALDEDDGSAGVNLAELAEARAELESAERALTAAHQADDAARASYEEQQRLQHALAAAHALRDRCEAEHARADLRVNELELACDRAAETNVTLTAELTHAEEAQPDLDAIARDAAAHRQAAEHAREVAELQRVEAERSRAHWAARAEALATALDATRSGSSVDAMVGHDGVDGLVADLIEITPGYEAAVTAALGEILKAVAVRTNAIGHPLLAILGDDDAHAVMLAVDAGGSSQTPLLPNGARPLADFVRSQDSTVAASLGQLLSHTVFVSGGLQDALDLCRSNPDLIVVTQRGDRIGGAVWQIGAAQPGVTRAAWQEAEDAASAAGHALDAAIAEVAEAGTTIERARIDEESTASTRRQGEERIGGLRRELTRVSGEREAKQRELEVASTSLATLVVDRDAAVAEAEGTAALIANLSMPTAPEVSGPLRRDADEKAAGARERLATLHLAAERRDAESAERRRGLATRLAEIEARLARHPGEQAQVSARREGVATDIASAATSQGRLEEARVALETMWESVMRRAAAADARRGGARSVLEGLRLQRAKNEETLAGIRQKLSQLDIDEAENKVRLEQATLAAREQYDIEPEVARGAEQPELTTGVSYTARARELERELRILGPVNPLAVEEYDAASERHTFLSQQLEDVKDARKELHRVIRTVDQEIVAQFESAFTDVAKHFEDLFTTLFPGGAGSLTLTDPNDLLHTGVEIEARPSGKNVRRLTLLSGGERSLTAMAYLFAVFRSRPSPFYLLDEVEAALDDVNLQRFLDLVDAFRDEAQLLIVTHQKRTMDAADSIYGISMPPGGSTKAVSQRLRKESA